MILVDVNILLYTADSLSPRYAEVRAQEEAAARQAMEARIAELEAELEALRDHPLTTGTPDADQT